MASKVELEIFKEDSLEKLKELKVVRNRIQTIIGTIDSLHDLLEFVDDHDDDEILVYRKSLSSRLSRLNQHFKETKPLLERFEYLKLDDYWPTDISDITGLTTPLSGDALESQKETIRGEIIPRKSTREPS